MALSDEIREQTVKLKDMSFKEKKEYIWEYYKWWFIGAVIAIIAIVSIARSVIQNSRPVYLTVYFLNTLVGLSDNAPTIEEDFVNAENIDTGKYNIYFDYSMYIDNDYTNQNSYTSQVRLMAQYSARTLDIICGPVSSIAGPASPGSYEHIENLLPAGMVDELINKGYEPYYYTEIVDTEASDDLTFDLVEALNGGQEISKETEEKLQNLKTETYIAGFYIDNCEYLKSQCENGIYAEGAEDRPVLVLAPGCQNIEHAADFIRFITK